MNGLRLRMSFLFVLDGDLLICTFGQTLSSAFSLVRVIMKFASPSLIPTSFRPSLCTNRLRPYEKTCP